MKIFSLLMLCVLVSGCHNRYATQHQAHILTVKNNNETVFGNLDSAESTETASEILKALSNFDKKYTIQIKVFSSKISPDDSLQRLQTLLQGRGYKYAITSALSTVDKIEIDQSIIITQGCSDQGGSDPRLGCITALNLEKMLIASTHDTVVAPPRLPHRAVKKLFSDKTKALKVEKIGK